MIATGGEVKSREPRRVHTPVLVEEVIASFAADRDPATLTGWMVDGTLGAGGHALAVLEAFPNVRLFGVDQDPEILELARENLAPFEERTTLLRARISQLFCKLKRARIENVEGMLFDLGASSLQFDRPERGFSFAADGPLDMRMDPDRRRTAAEIVNEWDEGDLADLIFYEGGEHRSRRIAHAIVESRRRAPFQRTAALAELIAHVCGQGRSGKIHPATRTFQALRRAVNEEGLELDRGLKIADRILADHGRLVVITFHSGEDGVVKRFLSERAREGSWQLANKKPLGPGVAERRANPRARSALLRCAERTRSQPG